MKALNLIYTNEVERWCSDHDLQSLQWVSCLTQFSFLVLFQENNIACNVWQVAGLQENHPCPSVLSFVFLAATKEMFRAGDIHDHI